MKLLSLIIEEKKKMHKITPVERKFLNLLNKMGVDPNDPGEVWTKLTRDPLHLKDEDLSLRLTYIFTEHWMDPDDEGETFDDLITIDLSGFNDTSQFDDEVRALSLETGTPPFMLERSPYRQYGLSVYNDILNGEEYAVGDDNEVEDAMLQYASDQLEYLDNFEEWWLDNYISPDEYAIEQFVEETVDNRLDDMAGDEIIDEAGYDQPEMEDEVDELMSKVEEFQEKMDEMQEEIEELEEQLGEMEEDDEEAFTTEEYQEIEEEILDKELEIGDLESDRDEAEGDASELRTKIDELEETAREELKEKYMESLQDDIDSEGLEYFTGNYGMDRDDAIDYYFHFDRDSAESDLAGETDWGDALSPAYGNYGEQEVDGITYYTFEQ